ncbi:hypothetical protein Q5P01_025566 [Channa striata]|uniref:Ig-like domain-containing protein n=1 Tax=Channa striata TaxID=64152 RepID=A0AA88IMM2_CHASR|nr:hypothetical protein Q5P01_025566 [Channa striata]
MLLAEAESVFLVLILYISRIQGGSNRMCVLEGSSVELPCSASPHTSPNRWYTVHWDGYRFIQYEFAADGQRVAYNMSGEGQPTLTITNLTETDSMYYCCIDKTDLSLCWHHGTELSVADLQVKVIPATEDQTVNLMCSTSCALSETPAAYIWYRNREFLYEDWSPWYQELVSSEEGVTYSCAIKGHEHLRAPDVSVDSVTSSCVAVTYAKGRMCSYQQRSEDEPCSITHPREVLLQRTPSYIQGYITLTCTSSCSPPAPQTTYMLYRNRCRRLEVRQSLSPQTGFQDSISCAFKGLEHLHSADVCAEVNNCWSVNYVSRRLCALEGSSVNISSKYTRPHDEEPKSEFWYKIQIGEEEAEKMVEDSVRVEYHSNQDHHTLTISNLTEEDSARYTFTLKDGQGCKVSELTGVTLVVTGLKVTFSPSAVVAEGQRVNVSCSTSCPLPANTAYVWYLNARPLQQNQSKHLVLDPVSSQHAGVYSCAVKTHNRNSSAEALSVQTKAGLLMPAAAAGLAVVLLVIITLTVVLWSRKKRSPSQPPALERSDSQLKSGPAHEDISAPQAEDELPYSTVCFKNLQTDPLYSSIQPRPPREQEQVLYAAVNLKSSE